MADNRCPVCGGQYTKDDHHEDCQIQAQEMRAETFAAEAMLGMRPGTTEGWYDHEEPPEPDDDGGGFYDGE